jgi:hypothetical protein
MNNAVRIELEMIRGMAVVRGEFCLAIAQHRIDATLGHFVGDRVHERSLLEVSAERPGDKDLGQADEMIADALDILFGFERPLGEGQPANALDREIVVRL